MAIARLAQRLYTRSAYSFKNYRSYSTNVYGEKPSKLRAFPFQLTPTQAEKRLARWASLICDDKVSTSAFPDISELLGFEYKRPDRMVPVYFPVWVFNAELEVKATQKDTQRDLSLQFVNSYLPGSHLTKLAAAPLWFKDPDYQFMDELQPFTDDLLRQHDLDVQCIPFTVSPFSLLQLAKTLPSSAFDLHEDVQFSPSTLKSTVFSAYPVLLPLYLAQYTTKESEGKPSSSVTMIVQAYSSMKGCIMAEPFFDVLTDTHRLTFEKAAEVSGWDLSNKEIINFDDVDDQLNVLSPALQTPLMTEVFTKMLNRLQHALHNSNNISQLASMDQFSLADLEKDPRIRELSFEEQTAIDKYFLLSNEIGLLKNLVETITNPHFHQHGEVKIINMGGAPVGQEGGDLEAMKSAFSVKLQDLEQAKEEATPQWLVEYRLSQQNESNTSS
ncbi:hypothetical protein CVT24_000389 [Panaeolus cyanescens]|uniref:Uncharacterized protein n=1 Tax=Panaeolus cyanescens TaxID=181874 RepID=A0A409YD31_9AGAR|nr:hypothetical protein CVT24_000389 [Panaeolus cyanescens]